MFAMVLLTLFVMIITIRVRVAAVRTGQVKLKYFETYSEGTPTPELVKTQRHFANLFEVPVLFYAGCLTAMVLNLTGFMIQFWAWLFVASRVCHTIIHLGSNRVMPRMWTFFVCVFAVMALWVQVVIAVAGASFFTPV
jgi:hypothetical protein